MASPPRRKPGTATPRPPHRARPTHRGPWAARPFLYDVAATRAAGPGRSTPRPPVTVPIDHPHGPASRPTPHQEIVMPSLTIVTGENAGKQFVLAKRRSPSARPRPATSRSSTPRSAASTPSGVRPRGRRARPRLRQGSNGVIINGNEIDAERVLADGDRIQLGDTELVYASSDEPDRTNALHQRKQADRKLRENNTLM